MRIDMVQPIQLLAAAEDGTPSRTIQGVAVPYNIEANASTGSVIILPGALLTDGPAPKLLMNHDAALPVGMVTERVDTAEAMLFSARVSATTAGNEALVLALDGVYDGVSVGLNATKFHYDKDTLVVEQADWRELSLVAFPAFPGARITQVAAEEGGPETETNTETSEEDPMPEIIEATAPIQTAPIFVGAAFTKPRITASEYIVAMLTGNKSVLAADNNALAQVPGLLPEPLMGDVWQSYFSGRPIIDAVGTRALPQAGETFFRRYIQQTTAVANQVAEFDLLAAQEFIVSRIQVDKKTFGGYLNVSAQSGDWSEPALIQQIINDMVRQYSIATEAYVGSRIANAADTATTTIATPTDGDEVIAALYDGAAEMRVATGVLPTHLIVSTDIWAQFGQAKDAGGNRIFPYLGPINAAGTSVGVANFGISPLGLNLVVSDDVAATNGATLVYAPALEVYEDRSRTGGIRVENPATASATIGLWGYMGVCVLTPLAGSAVGYVLSLI
jgi:HK97 family phage prohead protease